MIQRLHHKLAPQGVKLALPGLEGVAEAPLVTGAEASEAGLPRLLALLCSLELNGNLRSELEQTGQQERSCLLHDPLLMVLLACPLTSPSPPLSLSFSLSLSLPLSPSPLPPSSSSSARKSVGQGKSVVLGGSCRFKKKSKQSLPFCSRVKD